MNWKQSGGLRGPERCGSPSGNSRELEKLKASVHPLAEHRIIRRIHSTDREQRALVVIHPVFNWFTHVPEQG